MRPARDPSAGRSATPIYDELYAEWRRSFKALPGDRSGEDELGFNAFDAFGTGYGTHHHTPQHPVHRPPPDTSGHNGWHPAPQQHGTGHFPAALPPGPRRER
ncbi:hypothetical protein [Streptomyces sp. NBC_01304]|uniref:hypothetical protein n=1 Tax=Streptomyces sp. NBC_01304 TaxID=2903818 RepID=UPI002E0E14EC|nr:hypothetical protein OG430_37740 [Streptomyces sp. NBC_01304]